MNDSGWNMYVFRDGRKNVRGAELKAELLRWLGKVSESPNEDTFLGALIAAGELECALSDAASQSAPEAALITDQLARILVENASIDITPLAASVNQLQTPELVAISVAEGFAYYALHPLRFQAPVRRLAERGPIRVIGLRSIGTTLSAVVTAICTKSGVAAERITVRPTGHPYDRYLEFSPAETEWLLEAAPAATVLIVDEGPGLSGSSFLSVAEAVQRAGIAASQIVMLGSRNPEINQLRAPGAAQRWSNYRFVTADVDPILPPEASIDLSGGVWRHHFLQKFDDQPAAWTHLEPAKYMTRNRDSIYKFQGYGHFGEAIAMRSASSAESGFTPKSLGMARGFGKYEVVAGQLLSREDLNPPIVRRAAEYCAFRADKMGASTANSGELEKMAKWNWQCEFDSELRDFQLPVQKPVVADGRMLPHEWIRTRDGEILKLDSSTHGDDHFFPGPCDIAWDLAGMIVEWEMDSSQAGTFLQLYSAFSGDNPSRRISEYVLAYSIFRMSWCKMAAAASAGSFDEKLLMRDYMRYRNLVMLSNAVPEIRAARKTAPGAAVNPAVAC